MTIDNSSLRLHDVFFYGLYMDPAILLQKGVQPRNPRQARVDGYVLCIGNKATLLRAQGQSAYGMVYALTHEEIYLLYWGAGLDEYRSEAVLLDVENESITALTCNLLNPPAKDESNAEYVLKLKSVMGKLNVPLTFE